MNTGTLNSIALNSTVAGTAGGSKTYKTDGYLVIVQSKTYTTDGILRATQTRTYTNDALLQGGSTKFYSNDAILATPYHDNAPYGQMIGNNITRPIDPNRMAEWSTYSRPSSPINAMQGKNMQTGKIENWNTITNRWELSDGTAA